MIRVLELSGPIADDHRFDVTRHTNTGPGDAVLIVVDASGTVPANAIVDQHAHLTGLFVGIEASDRRHATKGGDRATSGR